MHHIDCQEGVRVVGDLALPTGGRVRVQLGGVAARGHAAPRHPPPAGLQQPGRGVRQLQRLPRARKLQLLSRARIAGKKMPIHLSFVILNVLS